MTEIKNLQAEVDWIVDHHSPNISLKPYSYCRACDNAWPCETAVLAQSAQKLFTLIPSDES